MCKIFLCKRFSVHKLLCERDSVCKSSCVHERHERLNVTAMLLRITASLRANLSVQKNTLAKLLCTSMHVCVCEKLPISGSEAALRKSPRVCEILCVKVSLCKKGCV